MMNFKSSYLFHILYAYGIDYKKLYWAVRNTPSFFKDLKKYKELSRETFLYDWKYIFPILTDKNDMAGAIDGHYFYQDMYVAKQIKLANPKRHVDIGSRMDGFISSLLVFRDVEVVDIRPFPLQVDGLSFIQDDATQMRCFGDATLESISSLHAAEHFGLGRYGDTVDPSSYKKFIQSLVRVLAKNGRLYFSLPSGIEKLYFNAHRVFSPYTILELFKDLRLVKLSAVLDNGEFIENCDPDVLAQQIYGCGIYEFTKVGDK